MNNPDRSFETIQYRIADNGVAFIGIDVPDRDVNILTPQLHVELGEVAARLASDDSVNGAVLHSAKQGFMAGGDLKRIVLAGGFARHLNLKHAMAIGLLPALPVETFDIIGNGSNIMVLEFGKYRSWLIPDSCAT